MNLLLGFFLSINKVQLMLMFIPWIMYLVHLRSNNLTESRANISILLDRMLQFIDLIGQFNIFTICLQKQKLSRKAACCLRKG